MDTQIVPRVAHEGNNDNQRLTRIHDKAYRLNSYVGPPSLNNYVHEFCISRLRNAEDFRVLRKTLGV